MSTLKPRRATSIPSSGPASPAPISVIVWGLHVIARTCRCLHFRKLLGQQRASLPEFGKEFLVQRVLEVRSTCAASGAHASSNDALHQLNVAQTPADHQLVELGQPLAYIDPSPVAMLIAVQRQHCARASFEPVTLCPRVIDLQLAQRAQRFKK